MSHNQECSFERVCSRKGLSSFSTGVANTEICVSYKTYEAMKGQSSRLRRYKRVFFHRGTSPESAKKIPIDGLLPHHIKQHAEVCAQKDRDFENEPGQRKQGRTDEELHSPRDSSGHNARGKWLARADKNVAQRNDCAADAPCDVGDAPDRHQRGVADRDPSRPIRQSQNVSGYHQWR